MGCLEELNFDVVTVWSENQPVWQNKMEAMFLASGQHYELMVRVCVGMKVDHTSAETQSHTDSLCDNGGKSRLELLEHQSPQRV